MTKNFSKLLREKRASLWRAANIAYVLLWRMIDKIKEQDTYLDYVKKVGGRN